MLIRQIYLFGRFILFLSITTTVQLSSYSDSITYQENATCIPKFFNLSYFVQYPANNSPADTNSWFESAENFNEEIAIITPLLCCGFRNKLARLKKKRAKRYTFSGDSWNVKNLTYTIAIYPRNLNESEVDGEIAKALALWSEHTDLTFTYKNYGPVDIKISFLDNEHGNCKPFDREKRILAHSFSPGKNTEVHFCIAQNWTIGTHVGINLLQVATHELGHALGLGHSQFNSAAMCICYTGYLPDFKLHEDDIAAIQALYGKKTPPDPRFCNDSKIDTIFTTAENRVYVFKGQNYYRINHNLLFRDYPRLIKEGWPGLPGDIDAAFTHANNKTYFFKNDLFWCYDGRKMDGKFPKKIVEKFIGIPTHLDAAMANRANNIIYFFKGSEYWRYDPIGSPRVKETYPKSISKWKGLPDNLDAAFQHPNGYRYFFKNDKYYRLSPETGSVDSAVPPYPRPIANYWFGRKSTKENGTSFP